MIIYFLEIYSTRRVCQRDVGIIRLRSMKKHTNNKVGNPLVASRYVFLIVLNLLKNGDDDDDDDVSSFDWAGQ